MSAIEELLDAVREKTGLPSDMALATRLGIQRQTLHQARKGVGGLSDERIAQLCEMAKLDGAVWMAKIHAEKATSPVERKVWRSVLDRLSAAAAVLVLVVIAAPGAARAKAIDSQGFSASDQPHSVYYVQSSTDTQPNTALQEPMHHIHIHQAQHPMTERLRQPPHHLKPQLPVQRNRRHIGTHHVIELHGEKSI